MEESLAITQLMPSTIPAKWWDNLMLVGMVVGLLTLS
jgi:hypothetical protein